MSIHAVEFGKFVFNWYSLWFDPLRIVGNLLYRGHNIAKEPSDAYTFSSLSNLGWKQIITLLVVNSTHISSA
jgi:hypothetical protein